MFALRGIAISLSVFAIIYSAISLLVLLTWRTIYGRCRGYAAKWNADLLFAMRIAPLVASVLVTAGLTVPSFLLLEPRSLDEPLSAGPVLLGFCGAGLMMMGVLKAGKALSKASRTIRLWSNESRAIQSSVGVPVVSISGDAPPVTAAGIVNPKVFLSEAAQAVLSADELGRALDHELAHVRRWDNLKKLLLCLAAFPVMRDLEQAWLEASEMAADDAAVSNSAEALDLAAALLKLSNLASNRPVELMATLVYCPVSALNARVERLLARTEYPQSGPKSVSWPRIGAAAATLGAFAFAYTPLLIRVHAATEWLVR